MLSAPQRLRVGSGGPQSGAPGGSTPWPVRVHIIDPDRSTTRQISRSSCVATAVSFGSNCLTLNTRDIIKFTGPASEPLVRCPVTRTAFGVLLPGLKLNLDKSFGCEPRPNSISLSASSKGCPATGLRLAKSLACAVATTVDCDRLNCFAPARAAASVDVLSSVRTSCIQATLIANAAMIMHNGRQTATSTIIAA